MRIRVLCALVLCVSVTYACKCQPQSSKDAFCGAHWVSHVKVKVRMSKQPLPTGASRKGLNNIKYSVDHIKVFKKPANLASLPTEIYTPSESPACGLIIDAGKEYLLAGRNENFGLFTVLCGQVLPDESTRTTFESVLEWRNVPAGFAESLEKITC